MEKKSLMSCVWWGIILGFHFHLDFTRLICIEAKEFICYDEVIPCRKPYPVHAHCQSALLLCATLPLYPPPRPPSTLATVPPLLFSQAPTRFSFNVFSAGSSSIVPLLSCVGDGLLFWPVGSPTQHTQRLDSLGDTEIIHQIERSFAAHGWVRQ